MPALPTLETLVRRASVWRVDGEPHLQAGDQQGDPGSVMLPAHGLSPVCSSAIQTGNCFFTAKQTNTKNLQHARSLVLAADETSRSKLSAKQRAS